MARILFMSDIGSNAEFRRGRKKRKGGNRVIGRTIAGRLVRGAALAGAAGGLGALAMRRRGKMPMPASSGAIVPTGQGRTWRESIGIRY